MGGRFRLESERGPRHRTAIVEIESAAPLASAGKCRLRPPSPAAS